MPYRYLKLKCGVVELQERKQRGEVWSEIINKIPGCQRRSNGTRNNEITMPMSV
ncbi:MAG: hypothetical protein JWL81_168 [Verrucomicrobiales bacterium]|nr:hypothetical protein [Verrucomicrobiales bacterium]